MRSGKSLFNASSRSDTRSTGTFPASTPSRFASRVLRPSSQRFQICLPGDGSSARPCVSIFETSADILRMLFRRSCVAGFSESPIGATAASTSVVSASRIHNTREASASRNESFNTAR